VFAWLKERKRTKLRAQPFPQFWADIIDPNVPYCAGLNEKDRQELQGHVQVLLAEKHFEGCAGFVITDEVKVTIAAHASFLLLHRDTGYFPRLRTILVYPTAFIVKNLEQGPGGTVSESDGVHLGESWGQGTVVLAWDEVEKSARHSADGYNVVLHEFAHQLDQEDGVADGAPILSQRDLYERWAEVLSAEYDQLKRDLKRRRNTLIDPYGATDAAEFFAVATETFFETPDKMHRRHPDLYQALRDYYQQDPRQYIADSPTDWLS